MNLIKYAALLALASIPLLLIKRGEEKAVRMLESDEIFDFELKAE